MNKIWAGPASIRGIPLWYRLERCASLAGLAATTTTNGVTTPQPFPHRSELARHLAAAEPELGLDNPQLRLVRQAVRPVGAGVLLDHLHRQPDLNAFRNHGGKILIWHGLADQLIFPQGTIQYYQRVQQAMGGPASTDSFARLFLAPGAQHCASATGSAPADPLTAVVNWVEHGQARTPFWSPSPTRPPAR